MGCLADVDDPLFARDLEYFSEKTMRKHLLENFPGTLPEHLKEKLKRAYPAAFGYMWVVKPLQAYKAETSRGLTKVSFWYGASKHYNWVPITGNLLFCVSRLAASDSEWKSLFFDERAKKCLGINADEAAAGLFETGNKHLSAGNFGVAGEYFQNAAANATDKALVDKCELALENLRQIEQDSSPLIVI